MMGYGVTQKIRHLCVVAVAGSAATQCQHLERVRCVFAFDDLGFQKEYKILDSSPTQYLCAWGIIETREVYTDVR